MYPTQVDFNLPNERRNIGEARGLARYFSSIKKDCDSTILTSPLPVMMFGKLNSE